MARTAGPPASLRSGVHSFREAEETRGNGWPSCSRAARRTSSSWTIPEPSRVNASVARGRPQEQARASWWSPRPYFLEHVVTPMLELIARSRGLFASDAATVLPRPARRFLRVHAAYGSRSPTRAARDRLARGGRRAPPRQSRIKESSSSSREEDTRRAGARPPRDRLTSSQRRRAVARRARDQVPRGRPLVRDLAPSRRARGWD